MAAGDAIYVPITALVRLTRCLRGSRGLVGWLDGWLAGWLTGWLTGRTNGCLDGLLGGFVGDWTLFFGG